MVQPYVWRLYNGVYSFVIRVLVCLFGIDFVWGRLPILLFYTQTNESVSLFEWVKIDIFLNTFYNHSTTHTMNLPLEIWSLIYDMQMEMGDFNPSIFNKIYFQVVQRKTEKSGWNSQNWLKWNIMYTYNKWILHDLKRVVIYFFLPPFKTD